MLRNHLRLNPLIFLFLFTTYGGAAEPNLAEGNVRGVIIEAATLQALPGANIFLPGTPFGAVSDENGRFEIIAIPSGKVTLEISLLGYEKRILHLDIRDGTTTEVKVGLRESLFQMDQVVVTATRTQKLLENVPVVTELITQSEIKESGAENLAQILEDRPGITIEEGVAGGKQLRMGGIDGKYILLLLDGMPISGKFNNRIELQLLDANRIDHIEIVKGPGSALYGSEAMGGVINIISKDFSSHFSLQGDVKLGTHDEYSGHAFVRNKHGIFSYRLAADHSRGGIDKNEISINVKDVQSTGLDGGLKVDSKSFGTAQINLLMKLDKQDGEDPVFYNQTKVTRRLGTIDWHKKWNEKLQAQLKGSISDYLRTYSETVRHSGHLARIDSTQETLTSLHSDFSTQVHPTVRMDWGLDFSHDRFCSARLSNRAIARWQAGLFVQSEYQPNQQFNFIIGGRYDNISDLVGYFSPRLSAMISFSPSFKIRSAWGSGFRAPSFTDMYIDYDNIFVGYRVVGNPLLSPEKSTGRSLGLEYFLHNHVLFNFTLYDTRFKDMIMDYVLQPAVLSYRNIEKAHFLGLEFQSKFYLDDNLNMTLSYNYTKVKLGQAFNEMASLNPHTGAMRLVYGFWKNRIKISLRDQIYGAKKVREFDRRTGQYRSTLQTKGAYHQVEASTQVRLCQMLSLQAGGSNLNNYVDQIYGPWIGRRFFIKLEATY